MGQYHYTVNLTKKQFLHPYRFGDGLKLLEQGGYGGLTSALHLLLACSSGRGGGDAQSDSPLIGSWAGDRIAVIGDYAEKGDIPRCDAKAVYAACSAGTGGWADISDQMAPIMEREFELVYVGDGWRGRVGFDIIRGHGGSHGVGDRTVCFAGNQTFPASQVREALRAFFATRSHYAVKSVTLAELGLTGGDPTRRMVAQEGR